MSDLDGSHALRSEIAAFYAGFGQPEVLCAAFEQALLVVPLIDQDRVFTSRAGGIDWICAFTSVEAYARYMSARGVEPDQQYRYHTLLGSRLAEYAASRSEPTGVAVDMAGTAPMAFPPNVSETSLAGDGNR
ncbi:SseB family protein [Nocardia sp. CA-120079]|uniref:SseB family protein n=1 Tax=Nocardia sp. CA-120079 TaxID=3239974 RepID=UPI003D95D6E7